VERRQQLEGGDDNDANDDARSLNSYIVFPDLHKLLPAETEPLDTKVSAGQKRKTMLLWNLLKDYALFGKENLQNDIKNKMLFCS